MRFVLPLSTAFAVLALFGVAEPRHVFADEAESRVGYRTSKKPGDSLKKYDGKVLIGREFELTERPLSTLIELFDLSEFPKEYLRSEDLTDYLLDDRAYEELPPDLKKKLSEGLKLSKPQIISGHVEIPQELRGEKRLLQSAGLLDAKGKPISQKTESSQVISPQSQISKPGIILPHGNPVPSQDHSWAELNRRWNQLPFGEKRAAVNINYLSRSIRARVLVRDFDVILHDSRKRAESELKQYFAEGVIIKQDGNALEFVDKNPGDQVSRFEKELEAFAKRVGISGSILDPENANRLDSSLHYHISRADLLPGQDVYQFAKELSRLITIREAAKDRMDLISGPVSAVAYQSEITTRGPVRAVNSNRIEIRVRFDSIERELDYVLRHFTMSDLNEATASVRKDVDAALTPRALRNLLLEPEHQDKVRDLLADSKYSTLLDVLENKGQFPAARHEMEAQAALEKAGIRASIIKPAFSWYMVGLLRAPDVFESELKDEALRLIWNDSSLINGNVYREFVSRIAASPVVISSVQSELQKDPSRAEFQKALRLITRYGIKDEKLALRLVDLWENHPDKQVKSSAAAALKEAGIVWKGVVETLIRIAQDEKAYEQLRAIEYLASLPKQDAILQARISSVIFRELESKDTSRRLWILSELKTSAHLDAKIKERVIDLVDDRVEEVGNRAWAVIDQQEIQHPRISKKIGELLKKKRDF